MKTKFNLIFRNGSIYTLNPTQTWAQAIAISGNRIVHIGSDQGVETLIDSDTAVIDLGGKMVLPGFIDAHAHPTYAMDFFINVNLYNLNSLEKYRQTITEFVKSQPDAEVIRGNGWDNTVFPDPGGPTKDILDALIPDRPVALMSNDAHSYWVNSAALAKANITKTTPNPPGGVIERDPQTGEPTGTLRETANQLIDHILPDYTLDERKRALTGYQEMAAKAGVTMVHDAMLDIPSIAALRTMEKESLLKMRFRGAVTMEPGKWQEQVKTLLEENKQKHNLFLHINTAKFFVDGVIEGRTALLLEPYAHKPGYRGEPIWDIPELNEAIREIDKLGLQIHIHVCGDAAARISLDALENAQQINGKRDSRHLITHVQLVTPEDIVRFKTLGIIAVPQPFWHKKDDYYWDLQLPYLGKERADKEYPMQSFLDAGVVIASASDFPVTIPFDPLIGIQTGVTRTDLQGTPENVLWPEEKASLEDLVKTYTYNGAYANFLETELGSLEKGKKADLIVIDQNIFDLHPTHIAQAKVLMTMINGEEVYRSPEFT